TVPHGLLPLAVALPLLAGDLVAEEHASQELHLAVERHPVLHSHADGRGVVRVDEGHQLRLPSREPLVAHPPRRLAGDPLPPRLAPRPPLPSPHASATTPYPSSRTGSVRTPGGAAARPKKARGRAASNSPSMHCSPPPPPSRSPSLSTTPRWPVPSSPYQATV